MATNSKIIKTGENGQNEVSSGLTTLEELSQAGILNQSPVDPASDTVGGNTLLSVAVPEQIIVSRTAPGTHVLALGGATAEEAIARLLSPELGSTKALAGFARTLATPAYMSKAIEILFKRLDTPMKTTALQVSDELVQNTIASTLVGQSPEVQAAYAYVLAEVLDARQLLVRSPPQNIVLTGKTYVCTMADLRTALLIGSIRGVFDASRIKAMVASISDEITPKLMGEKLGNLFRSFAHALPQIATDLMHLEVALHTVNEYLTNPDKLPLEVASHESLASLATYANIIRAAVTTTSFPPAVMSQSIETRRRACDYLLTAIASSDMFEVMSLSKFAEHFYQEPAMAADGERRGLILAARYGQESAMTVVDVYAQPGTTRLIEQEPSLVYGPGIAPLISKNLTSDHAMQGIVSLLAEDLAHKLATTASSQPFRNPELWTFQVTPDDMVYLAMARARTLMLVRAGSQPTAAGEAMGPGKARTFVYGVQVQSGWRMPVMAATSSDVYFADPASVLLYTSDQKSYQGRAYPSRPQGIGTRMAADTLYAGSISHLLSKSVAIPYRAELTISGLPAPLELEIPILSEFLAECAAETGGAASARGAYYASLCEVGVDHEVKAILGVICYYMTGSDKVLADKAASWLVNHLTPLMSLPVISGMAQKAVNDAVIKAKIDARTMTSQLQEVYIRALFAVVLAVLNRFNKVTSPQVTALATRVPVHTLSMQATLQLATLPGLYRR